MLKIIRTQNIWALVETTFSKRKIFPSKFLRQDVQIFLDRFLEKFASKDWKAEYYKVKAVSKDIVKTIDEGDLIDLGDMQLKVNF